MCAATPISLTSARFVLILYPKPYLSKTLGDRVCDMAPNAKHITMWIGHRWTNFQIIGCPYPIYPYQSCKSIHWIAVKVRHVDTGRYAWINTHQCCLFARIYIWWPILLANCFQLNTYLLMRIIISKLSVRTFITDIIILFL